MRTATTIAALACLLACGSDDDDDSQPPADAGTADGGDVDAGDAGREAWGCACEQGEEDCAACIASIGTCCYDDATIGGQAERLAGTCTLDGACTACCNECAAKSCEDLRAAGGCPAASQTPWSMNGVVARNGLLQDLAAAPLSTEGLEAQEGLAGMLDDPNFHKFVAYVVQCALPADAELQVGDEVLSGGIGLAPEWAEGPCEIACQEWVSACMLARSNAFGVAVILNMTSTNPGMQAQEDDANYPEQEGAFWGNMFLEVPVEYACRGDGRDPLLGTFRVCAQPGSRCAMQNVGPCGPIDGATAEPSERHACETFDEGARAYTRCHNRASEPGSNAFPEGTTVSERVITTWVAHTAFQEGYADACEDEGEVVPFAPDDVPGGPGAVCDNDDDCDGAQGLHCDARFDFGFCTKPCEETDVAGAEEDQCGPDATCLTQFNGAETFCTAACEPHSRGGDCPAGEICTSHSFWLGTPDDPGCRPFCSSDADCPPHTPCDRFGLCGAGVDAERIADGDPCTFVEGTSIPVVPCRGGCFRADADPSHGICGSFIDTAVTDDCPDDPASMLLQTRDDDLGVCNYRHCVGDEDCTTPLVCTDTPRGMLCTYPS